MGSLLTAFRWVHNHEIIKEVVGGGGGGNVMEGVELSDLDPSDLAMAKDLSKPPMEECEDMKVKGKTPNEVHVMVVKGKNIQAMDGKGILGGLPSVSLPGFGKKKMDKKKKEKKKEGTSDPFVTITTTTSEGTKAKYKTEVIKKTLEPVWDNNKFAIPESDPGSVITMELRDSDMVSTEFMGKASVPISNFSGRREVRDWYTLTNKDGVIDQDRGRILVSVRWVYNPKIISESEAMDPNDMGPPMEVEEDKEVKPANRINVFVIR